MRNRAKKKEDVYRPLNTIVIRNFLTILEGLDGF